MERGPAASTVVQVCESQNPKSGFSCSMGGQEKLVMMCGAPVENLP